MFFKKSHADVKAIDDTGKRLLFSGDISLKTIKSLAKNQSIEILQTDKPISIETAQALEKYLFSKRPDVHFRIYGCYQRDQICDLSICEHMPSLTGFYADCLQDAININAVSTLHNIQHLSLGIYNNDSLDTLNHVPETLSSLSVGQTKSKKPSLAALSRFKTLETLFIDSQSKEIMAISCCTNIQKLTLRGIKTDNLDYLGSLDRLETLNIHLGSIKNFEALKDMPQIQALELFQIRDLSNIEFLSDMIGLQTLFLQNLNHVNALPDLQRLDKLKRIVFENLKSMKDLSALENIPHLEECLYIAAQNLQPEDFIPLLKNNSVKRVLAGFGSDKRNKIFQELAIQHGKKPDMLT